MATFILIDNIKNQRWKSYAQQIDNRKPDISDPNDVGDAGDRKLSKRELEKLEQKITEYYTANPEIDSLGVEVPVGKSVSEAMTEVHGGALAYLKHKAGELWDYITQNFSKSMQHAGGPASRAIEPLLSQVR